MIGLGGEIAPEKVLYRTILRRKRRSLRRIGIRFLEGSHAFEPVPLVFSVVGPLDREPEQTGYLRLVHVEP